MTTNKHNMRAGQSEERRLNRSTGLSGPHRNRPRVQAAQPSMPSFSILHMELDLADNYYAHQLYLTRVSGGWE